MTTNPSTPPRPPAERHVVELTGPGGCGKSALIEQLQRRLTCYVGKPRGVRKQRLRPALAAVARLAPLALAGRVSPRSYRRLFKMIVRVERGVRWCETLAPGVYVLDEGPLRTLADMTWRPGAEFDAWTRYASAVVHRLGRSGVHATVCRLCADERTRFHRRRQRWAADERREKGAVTRTASYEQYREAAAAERGRRCLDGRVAEWLACRLPGRATVIELDNSGDRSLDDLAAELIDKLPSLAPHALPTPAPLDAPPPPHNAKIEH